MTELYMPISDFAEYQREFQRERHRLLEELKSAREEIKELKKSKDDAIDKLQGLLTQEVLNDDVVSDVGVGIDIAIKVIRGGENESRG